MASICRVCHEEIEDTKANNILAPCQCTGSVSFIHLECYETLIKHESACGVCLTTYPTTNPSPPASYTFNMVDVNPQMLENTLHNVNVLLQDVNMDSEIISLVSIFTNSSFEYGTYNIGLARFLSCYKIEDEELRQYILSGGHFKMKPHEEDDPEVYNQLVKDQGKAKLLLESLRLIYFALRQSYEPIITHEECNLHVGIPEEMTRREFRRYINMYFLEIYRSNLEIVSNDMSFLRIIKVMFTCVSTNLYILWIFIKESFGILTPMIMFNVFGFLMVVQCLPNRIRRPINDYFLDEVSSKPPETCSYIVHGINSLKSSRLRYIGYLGTAVDIAIVYGIYRIGYSLLSYGYNTTYNLGSNLLFS